MKTILGIIGVILIIGTFTETKYNEIKLEKTMCELYRDGSIEMEEYIKQYLNYNNTTITCNFD